MIRWQHGKTPWRTVIIVAVAGLAWLLLGGSVKCQGGPAPSVQVQVGRNLPLDSAPPTRRP